MTDVSEGTDSAEGYLFTIEETEPFQYLQATGQMIADPDHFAFYYVLTTGKKEIFIRFEQRLWPVLDAALQQEALPIIKWGQQEIPMLDFHKELQKLINSIQGSGVYDEVFVQAVASCFA